MPNDNNEITFLSSVAVMYVPLAGFETMTLVGLLLQLRYKNLQFRIATEVIHEAVLT